MATMHADGKANSCTVASAGIMVGRPDPMLGFPKKVTFAPYAFARNAGAATHVLHMLVNYMDKTGPHSAPLPDRVLAPGEAGSLNLDKAIQLPFTDGSINLSFTLDTGCDSVLMGVGSVDPTGNYVFAVDPAGVGKGGGKSSLYWEVGKGVSTMYSLWNPTSQAEDLLVTVQFDPEGTYKAPVHLEGNASTMLDLMELVEGGKPDADGHTIPPGIRTGSLLILPAKNDLREFINVVVSSGTYSPLTGTCGQGCETCTGMVRVEIDPGNFMVSIGMGQQLAYVLTDTFGNRTNYTNSSNWSSNQTQVMTVQTMGQSSAGMTAGVGAGSADIQGELAQQVPINAGQICAYPLPSCPIAQNPVAQASAFVQVPTSLKVLSAVSVGCPGSKNYGITIDVQYQVLDQTGQVIKVAGMIPWEKGTFFTGGNFDQQLGMPTLSDGTFHDIPGACSPVPIPGLPLTATQAITMHVGTTVSPVIRNQTLTLSAPAGAAGFGHGTIKNNLPPDPNQDINVSR